MKRIILFPLLFISIFAFSQNIRVKANLKGVVTDAQTSEVLPFANVVLFQDSEMVQGVLSDFDGNYSFRNIPVGEYKLRISFIGFTPVELTGIIISPNQTRSIDIKMNGQTLISFCTICCCGPRLIIETPPDLIAEQDSINKIEDQLVPSTGLESSFSEVSFTAYPNPTLGLMTLTNVPKTDEMLLFDLTGKIVRTIQLVDDKPIMLDLTQLESGMYFLKYTEFGQQKTKKLIRQ